MLWEVLSISTVQLYKTLCMTLACRNTPMKSSWCNLELLLVASAKKYFLFLIDAVEAQVSPIISLFCKYYLNIILNLNLSRLPSDWVFAL